MKKRLFCSCLSYARAVVLLVLLCSFSLFPVTAESARQTVRVGFFAFEGYHMMDENGARSGYGYDFLQLIKRYLNVDYEYIGYETSWDDMLDMLENDEIDLVTSSQVTKDRMEKFAFSNPIGRSSAMLTTRNTNQVILSGEYATYDGKRIGMLQGNSRNEDLEQFAAEKGFTYTPVYFELSSELELALMDGRVDMAISSSLRQTHREKVLDTFASHDFYVIVRKADVSLLHNLNYAIGQLGATEGDWQSQLNNKYYQHTQSRDLLFSARELALIREYAAGRKTLIVSACTDKKPYAYAENGVAKGIMFDYFDKLADYCSIPYTLLVPKDRAQYVEWCEAGLVDVCLDGRFENESQAEQLGRTPSAPYTTMRLVMVTRRDFDGEIHSLAVSGSQGLFGIEDGLAPGAQRISVESREEGMNAVLHGKADATIVYLYTAQQFVNEDTRGLLTYTLLSEPTYDYHLSFGANVSHELAGIFTKAIYAMPTGTYEDIAAGYTSYKAENVDIITWIQINPGHTIVLCAAVFLSILLAVLLRSRQKLIRLERTRSEEYQLLARKAEEASCAKSEFLANISHDIRTPMNAIVGLTELMVGDVDIPLKQKQQLQKIRTSSRHLLDLINDMLDMGRIENRQTMIHPEPMSLSEQLSQVSDIVREDLEKHKHHFTFQKDEILHDQVVADGVRVRQVLINLLSNAIKYTPDGGELMLLAKELSCENGKAQYRFTVTDNGKGMSDETKAHLFEPFTRGEASVTNKIQGTGLGMAITGEIVKRMGGHITVESEPDKGTKVEVTVAFPVIAETENVVGKDISLSGVRFLCAEDNELNAEILCSTLELYGATCKVYPDGEALVEAFQTIRPGEYDAILMDIQMPYMNGLEAAKRIRASANPVGATIPIFAMTANAFEEDIQKSLAAGMNAHLSKPLDVAALAGALAEQNEIRNK